MDRIRMTKKRRLLAQHCLDLQSRKAHPDGRCDNGGRWYPNSQFDCCKGIREPSRAYPWSMMAHCRTVDHVAHQHKIDPKILRKLVNRLKKEIPLNE